MPKPSMVGAAAAGYLTGPSRNPSGSEPMKLCQTRSWAGDTGARTVRQRSCSPLISSSSLSLTSDLRHHSGAGPDPGKHCPQYSFKALPYQPWLGRLRGERVAMARDRSFTLTVLALRCHAQSVWIAWRLSPCDARGQRFENGPASRSKTRVWIYPRDVRSGRDANAVSEPVAPCQAFVCARARGMSVIRIETVPSKDEDKDRHGMLGLRLGGIIIRGGHFNDVDVFPIAPRFAWLPLSGMHSSPLCHIERLDHGVLSRLDSDPAGDPLLWHMSSEHHDFGPSVSEPIWPCGRAPQIPVPPAMKTERQVRSCYGVFNCKVVANTEGSSIYVCTDVDAGGCAASVNHPWAMLVRTLHDHRCGAVLAGSLRRPGAAEGPSTFATRSSASKPKMPVRSSVNLTTDKEKCVVTRRTLEDFERLAARHRETTPSARHELADRPACHTLLPKVLSRADGSDRWTAAPSADDDDAPHVFERGDRGAKEVRKLLRRRRGCARVCWVWGRCFVAGQGLGAGCWVLDRRWICRCCTRLCAAASQNASAQIEDGRKAGQTAALTFEAARDGFGRPCVPARRWIHKLVAAEKLDDIRVLLRQRKGQYIEEAQRLGPVRLGEREVMGSQQVILQKRVGPRTTKPGPASA
ncbi:uncharacterized protein PSFLO_00148 [Pseudozyma flocculosa]|uniref:Uncharacterized protein n=1 Tax=Pseudozyma flocculosa TaxID=84751 RepID=A0A5C3ET34_9BASI|nr:uncharacterized protein PSFLO_00148 [Pseudozyma flocculosa]